MGISMCTIVSKNYLSFARVLAKSFLEHHDGKVYVLLSDKVDGYFDPKEEPFELFTVEDLNIKDFEAFCFKYSQLEFNTAVKPFFLEFLLGRFGMEKLAYIDPDILMIKKMEDVIDILDSHSLVLTPHITAPYNDDRKPSEVNLLATGTYNLGFIAMRNNSETKSFLSWWAKRLYDKCIVGFGKDLFVDQKWINHAPGMYDTFILRKPGYNVAYWNLHCRHMELKDGEWFVNNEPLIFFHFSGFNPRDLDQISKHQDRWTFKDLPHIKPLFKHYSKLQVENGYDEVRNWPYAYCNFDNNVKIPDVARRIYYNTPEDVRAAFGNPFTTGQANSFQDWLNRVTYVQSLDSSTPITNLLYAIYESRPELQLTMPNIFSRYSHDLRIFYDWIVQWGVEEYGLDDFFLAPIGYNNIKQ